jgi:hypothetical protein
MCQACQERSEGHVRVRFSDVSLTHTVTKKQLSSRLYLVGHPKRDRIKGSNVQAFKLSSVIKKKIILLVEESPVAVLHLVR